MSREDAERAALDAAPLRLLLVRHRGPLLAEWLFEHHGVRPTWAAIEAARARRQPPPPPSHVKGGHKPGCHRPPLTREPYRSRADIVIERCPECGRYEHIHLADAYLAKAPPTTDAPAPAQPTDRSAPERNSE